MRIKLLKKKMMKWAVSKLQKKLNSKVERTEKIEFLTNALLKELNTQGITLRGGVGNTMYLTFFCCTDYEDSRKLSEEIELDVQNQRVVVTRTEDLY